MAEFVVIVMSDHPKHPDPDKMPAPADRHGGEHGVPPGIADGDATGLPNSDRHETEKTHAKDQD